MAETTCWTKDDMPRALEWVRREAKAGLEFRAERVNVVEALRELGCHQRTAEPGAGAAAGADRGRLAAARPHPSAARTQGPDAAGHASARGGATGPQSRGIVASGATSRASAFPDRRSRGGSIRSRGPVPVYRRQPRWSLTAVQRTGNPGEASALTASSQPPSRLPVLAAACAAPSPPSPQADRDRRPRGGLPDGPDRRSEAVNATGCRQAGQRMRSRP